MFCDRGHRFAIARRKNIVSSPGNRSSHGTCSDDEVSTAHGRSLRELALKGPARHDVSMSEKVEEVYAGPVCVAVHWLGFTGAQAISSA